MPSPAYRLSAGSTTITLAGKRRGQVQVSVANEGRDTLRTRLDLRPLPPLAPGGLSLSGEEFLLDPGSTRSLPLGVDLPQQLAPGTYTCEIRAVGVDNPNEWVSSPLVLSLVVVVSGSIWPVRPAWVWASYSAAILAITAIVVMITVDWLPGLILLGTSVAVAGMAAFAWWRMQKYAQFTAFPSSTEPPRPQGPTP